MKQALAVLLIALLASMMVSAKVHHRKRDHDDSVEGPHHHRDSDDDDDNSHNHDKGHDDDDDDDHDNDDDKMLQCYFGMMTCAESMKNYETANFTAVGQSIKSEGITEVCNDMTEATECALGVLLSGNCDSFPDEVKDVAKKMFGLINYICITKIDEIQANRKCLFNTEVDNSLDTCNNYETDLENCKPGKFLNCVEAAMKKNDDCTEEAFNLVTEIVNEAIGVMPTCQQGDESFGSENNDGDDDNNKYDDDDNDKIINYSRRIARFLKQQLLKRK